MTPEQESAQSAYDAAKRRLAECKPNDRGAEANFAITHRRLTVLGMAMRVKRKYGPR